MVFFNSNQTVNFPGTEKLIVFPFVEYPPQVSLPQLTAKTSELIEISSVPVERTVEQVLQILGVFPETVLEQPVEEDKQ